MISCHEKDGAFADQRQVVGALGQNPLSCMQKKKSPKSVDMFGSHRSVSSRVLGSRASSLYAGTTIVRDLVASLNTDGASICTSQHLLLDLSFCCIKERNRTEIFDKLTVTRLMAYTAAGAHLLEGCWAHKEPL